MIGKSGSGKSTLIDVICGFHKPFNGEILVDNKDINKANSSWLEKISYVSQKVFIINDTLKKNIALGIEEKNINIDLVKKLLSNVDLRNF